MTIFQPISNRGIFQAIGRHGQGKRAWGELAPCVVALAMREFEVGGASDGALKGCVYLSGWRI